VCFAKSFVKLTSDPTNFAKKEKMTDKKSPGTGSPRKMYPELYYAHVYIDKQLFDTVRLFGHWNILSIKSAVHQILIFGKLLRYRATAIRASSAGK
jgi:hypothetical protein